MAFLVRLWQEGEAATMRVTLENPHNGKRYVFANLEELVAFLEDVMGGKLQKGDENCAP